MRRLTPAPMRSLTLSLIALTTLFTLGFTNRIPVQAADPGFITAKTWIDPASGHAAVGDGVADDTQNLGDGVADDTQNLQDLINYGINNAEAVRLEPGIYRITKTLLISHPFTVPSQAGQRIGFRLSGIGGPNASPYNPPGDPRGGVSIVMDAGATTQQAILQFGDGYFYDTTIENIGMISKVSNYGTPYGLMFSSQEFSHVKVHMVSIANVGTDFALVLNPQQTDSKGNSINRNGEDVNIDNCTGDGRCFYSNNSGQSFYHRILNCQAGGPNGSTAIKIGQGNLGFDMDITGFSYTFGAGPLRNTLVENDGVSGTVNIKGGRIEECDTLLAYSGSTSSMSGHIKIEGMDLDFGPGNFPILDDTQCNGVTVNRGYEQYTNLFENDAFYSSGALRLASYGGNGSVNSGDNSTNSFRDCTFSGFTNKLTDLTNVGGVNQLQQLGINIRDCRATSNPNTGYFANMSYP